MLKHDVLVIPAYICRYKPSSRYLRHMQTYVELSIQTEKHS
jgi:hypothetical protein